MEARSAKRQKVATACDVCRAKKTKCDGARPTCSPCMKRPELRDICAYTDDKDAVASGKSYVHHLEAQIRRLQHRDTSPSEQPDAVPRSRVSDASGFASPQLATPFSAASGPHRAAGEPTQDSPVSSYMTSSFMEQIKGAMAGAPSRVSSSGKKAPAVLIPSPSLQEPSRRRCKPEDAVLPPRWRADHLVDTYWQRVHPMFPVLDRDEFDILYESLWSSASNDYDEPLLMCRANLVFALGWQADEEATPHERRTMPETFFARAKNCFELDFWELGSIDHVRHLLLMCQYLQSSEFVHLAWKCVGLAKRSAQGLGFHLPETSAQLADERQQQWLRILWHDLVFIDRALCVSVGKAPIEDHQIRHLVPLPKPSDVGVKASADQGSRRNKPLMISFLIEQAKLVGIVAEITQHSNESPSAHDDTVLDPYETYFGGTEKENNMSVFSLDRRLRVWNASLPRHLQIASPEHETDATIRMQARHLRGTYLHAQVLLHRPVLARFCLAPSENKDGSSDCLPQQMALSCSSTCLRAARDGVDTIYEDLDLESMRGVPGSWGTTVSFVYSAATVLQAIRLKPIVAARVEDYDPDKSWSRALAVLGCLGQFGGSARRCVDVLEKLCREISEYLSQRSVTSQQNIGFIATPAAAAAGDSSEQNWPWQSGNTNGFDEAAQPLPFDKYDWGDLSWLWTTPTDISGWS